MQVFLRFLLLTAVMFTSKIGISNEIKDMAAYIQTSKGEIVIALNSEKASITVKNFIRYAEEGFYNDTIFHRVIDGFVIQGGGMAADMKSKKTHEPIHNESDNSLQNLRGTISMARTQDPNSATSQFFINLKDNFTLDYKPNNWGYTVFGQVVEGMDVVDKIAKVPVGNSGGHNDVPQTPVIIETVAIKEAPGPGLRERIKSSLQKTIRSWFL